MKAYNRLSPFTFDYGCLEGQCGQCSLMVNGKSVLSCSVFLREFSQPMEIEAAHSFPVLRDLKSDRSVMTQTIIKSQAWNIVDDWESSSSFQKRSPALNSSIQDHESCLHCGICLSVCPQISESQQYIGAYGIHRTLRSAMTKEFSEHREDHWRRLRTSSGVVNCDQVGGLR